MQTLKIIQIKRPSTSRKKPAVNRSLANFLKTVFCFKWILCKKCRALLSLDTKYLFSFFIVFLSYTHFILTNANSKSHSTLVSYYFFFFLKIFITTHEKRHSETKANLSAQTTQESYDVATMTVKRNLPSTTAAFKIHHY